MATIYYVPSGCNCDNKTAYDQGDINAACTQALQLASEKKTVGKDKYPHTYNDYEKFTFAHAKTPYLEFPILSDQKAFTGSESPGADRVVIGSIATDFKSAVFCAVLTHDESTKNGFTECKDDTLNTDGKGTYEKRNQGKNIEQAPDRSLLEYLE